MYNIATRHRDLGFLQQASFLELYCLSIELACQREQKNIVHEHTSRNLEKFLYLVIHGVSALLCVHRRGARKHLPPLARSFQLPAKKGIGGLAGTSTGNGKYNGVAEQGLSARKVEGFHAR